VLGTALSGRSKERPELAEMALPFEVTLAVVPSRSGERLPRRLFEPLGYAVQLQRHVLDASFPEWGDSAYYTLRLEAKVCLRELLTHLYVLVPVLDDNKHYWVGDDEVAKLLQHGESWLPHHPERDLIARRYLKHQRSLHRAALDRLEEGTPASAEDAEPAPAAWDDRGDEPLPLHQQRLEAVLEELHRAGSRRVLDLGCGEGRLLELLLEDRRFDTITGMDVSFQALERARDRLRLDHLPEQQRDRVMLLHGSLVYRDHRLAGFDAAAVVEVVEHLDPPRLAAFERVLFEFARPGTIVLTTPNREYNVRYETLPAGKRRHPDHRFEWTRDEFQAWAAGVAVRRGYAVRHASVGDDDPVVGAPTQMAVFSVGGRQETPGAPRDQGPLREEHA